MTDLNELVTDLGNINASLVKTSTDLGWMADRYDNNAWLKNQLWELEDDLDKVINRLAELRNIYNFKGGE